MWYWLKVDALIALAVFAPAGLIILGLFVWQEAKALAAARHRIYDRLLTLTTQPQFFTNPLAISRRVSRNASRDRFAEPRFH
jgi:hypothetical protein